MSLGRLGFLAEEDKFLSIAPQIRLPYDIATLTIAFLAMRGSGKTYAAMDLVEEMIQHGLHVVCIDPIGVHWGLKSSADGKHEGLPVVILGGDHADVPLDVLAGSAVADFVMESRQPCVLDLSLMRKGEQTRFMTDFAERLYHKNRASIHLVVDEADAFANQRPQPDQMRLLGAMEDLVRRGRARGIGLTLISQRPAVIHKNVLSQIEVLVALRMTAPHDISAIKQWIHHHGTEEEQDKVLSTLSSLPRGVGWFWSPGWLKVLKKIEFRRRKTFDSSATPAPGKTIAPPEAFAKVDLALLRERLASSIEKAKEEDPEALRARVKELEAALKKSDAKTAQAMSLAKTPRGVEEIVERVPTKLYKRLLEVWQHLSTVEKSVEADIVQARATLQSALDLSAELRTELFELEAIVEEARFKPHASNGAKSHAHANEETFTKYVKDDARVVKEFWDRTEKAKKCDSSLTGPERKILSALATRESLSTKQIAVLTGYVVAGHFNNSMGGLRSKGFIEGTGDFVRITEEGRSAVGPVEDLPTGRALLDYWLEKKGSAALGKVEKLALKKLVDVYPRSLSTKELAERIGYEVAGHFNNGIGRLRTLQLVEGRGELRASGAFAGGA